MVSLQFQDRCRLQRHRESANTGIMGAAGPVITQSAGRRACENDSVLPVDATLGIYSFTKLITTIAALQCIERGQIHLDDHVDVIHPELKQPLVIHSGCQDGKDFSLKASTGKITLRHLLTHTSGIGYDAVHPLLRRWRETRDEEPQMMCGDVIKAYSTPLLFEPGQSWAYGGGLDWAGILIGRLNKQVLGSYMAENIFEPLGMTNTTFHPKDQPELMAKAMDTVVRTPEGTLVPIPPMYREDAETDAGGIGLFSSLIDFTKIIEDLLRDEPILLKPSTRDQMFVPQFSPNGPQAEGMSAMSVSQNGVNLA